MLAKIQTCTVAGVDAVPVAVEIYMREGQLPGISTVGLPDAAVRESKDRILAALMTSGFPFPLQRITINLAPANIKKEGSAFDLPIATGLLTAMGIIHNAHFNDTVIVGELSLDGKVRPVRGILPIAAGAYRHGWKKMIVPKENAREAAVVEALQVFGIESLRDVIEILNGNSELEPFHPTKLAKSEVFSGADLADVKGQEYAKRAMEVAAAGGHNMIMIGPPGSGKTMLAHRIPSILPHLTFEEALEITKIHSVVGLLNPSQGLVTQRPFRAPHHSISDAGLIGGGSHPMPGEVSLAHNGVLFLDELPEFKRHVLEVMRQPIEDGFVTIARAQMTVSYPSRCMLVAAMNPCPCGWKTHPEKECRCLPYQIDRYLNKISGPLLDRIDIHLEVAAVNFKELSDNRRGESSEIVRKRVEKARQIQLKRFHSDTRNETRQRIYCNAQMRSKDVEKFCHLDKESKSLLENAMNQLGFSARAYHRILKVARTIADLDTSPDIQPHHLAEAIQYRSLDRSNWTSKGY